MHLALIEDEEKAAEMDMQDIKRLRKPNNKSKQPSVQRRKKRMPTRTQLSTAWTMTIRLLSFYLHPTIPPTLPPSHNSLHKPSPLTPPTPAAPQGTIHLDMHSHHSSWDRRLSPPTAPQLN